MAQTAQKEKFLYDLKDSLVTGTEMEYLKCIKSVLPKDCLVQAQVNLASFIVRTDGARFQNELYRNVDFLITDLRYRPLVAIEINDKTHLTQERKERDKKVANICEEAGIPLIKFWTSYGVNPEYIEKKIKETINALPVERICHSAEREKTASAGQAAAQSNKGKEGCYIATCVYGSYDCPQVWMLRRFRDNDLRKSWWGRAFIKIYYAVSPTLVKVFGNKKSIKILWKKALDAWIVQLQKKGIKDTPYTDSECEK